MVTQRTWLHRDFATKKRGLKNMVKGLHNVGMNSNLWHPMDSCITKCRAEKGRTSRVSYRITFFLGGGGGRGRGYCTDVLFL